MDNCFHNWGDLKTVLVGDILPPYIYNDLPKNIKEIIYHDEIRNTLIEAGCELQDVVKAMVWLKNREDFPGFNSIYGEYFDNDPPARSAVVSDLLVDALVEVEVVAYKPGL